MSDTKEILERYQKAFDALSHYLNANKPESGPEYSRLLDDVNAAHDTLVSRLGSSSIQGNATNRQDDPR